MGINPLPSQTNNRRYPMINHQVFPTKNIFFRNFQIVRTTGYQIGIKSKDDCLPWVKPYNNSKTPRIECGRGPNLLTHLKTLPDGRSKLTQNKKMIHRVHIPNTYSILLITRPWHNLTPQKIFPNRPPVLNKLPREHHNFRRRPTFPNPRQT